MILYNKRGELTTKQIVTLVILILSFIIILFFIFRLNIGETTSKDLCRNSIIAKAQSPLKTSPINCKTQYICLSKTGNCDKADFLDQVIKVQTPDDVYRTLADKMAECWWMFGAGEINYIGSEAFPDLYCSICNQVYFDSSVKQIFNGSKFSQRGLYQYITTKDYTKDEQYDEYMYEVDYKDAESFLYQAVYTVEQASNSDIIDKVVFPEIDLDKPSLILMGIKGELSKTAWAVFIVGSTLVTTGLILSGIGAFGAGTLAAIAAKTSAVLLSTKVLMITAGGTAIISGVMSSGKSGNYYVRPQIIEKDSDHFNKLECDDVLTRS